MSAAATMTTTWMAGSERIRRHWHATQRDCGRESDESFSVKHVSLLFWFKQKFVCVYMTTPDRRQGLQGLQAVRTRSRVVRSELFCTDFTQRSDLR
jgi:hypothetical protein